MRGLSLAFLASLTILLVIGAPAGADIVIDKDGKPIAGDKISGAVPTDDEVRNSKIIVVAENYDWLLFKFRTIPQTQKHSAADVKQVYYEDRDAQYDRAVRLMKDNNLEEALEAMKQAAGSSVRWVPQYAMWEIARIHQAIGQPQEALSAVEALIRKIPRTKFLIRAHKMAAMIRLYGGDPRGAKAEFEKIRRIPKIPEDLAREVDYYLVFIREQQAKSKPEVSQVKNQYEALMRKVEGKFKNVESLCRLGIGRCLVTLGKAEEALEFFKEIVRTSRDDSVLAGAYLMIGEAYFSLQKWTNAGRAFLRVCVLWEENPEIHAQALCRAGNCFLNARAAEFKNRARRELQECYTRYPGSIWGKRARDLAGRIK